MLVNVELWSCMEICFMLIQLVIVSLVSFLCARCACLYRFCIGLSMIFSDQPAYCWQTLQSCRRTIDKCFPTLLVAHCAIYVTSAGPFASDSLLHGIIGSLHVDNIGV